MAASLPRTIRPGMSGLAWGLHAPSGLGAFPRVAASLPRWALLFRKHVCRPWSSDGCSCRAV